MKLLLRGTQYIQTLIHEKQEDKVMSRDEYVSYLADKFTSGEIDFPGIRRELKRYNFNNAQSSLMIKLVDRELLSRIDSESSKSKGNIYILIGSLLTIAGLIHALIFLGFPPFLYFFGCVPFGSGLALIVAGRRARLRNNRLRIERPFTGRRD